jgi:hypothetical protein
MRLVLDVQTATVLNSCEEAEKKSARSWLPVGSRAGSKIYLNELQKGLKGWRKVTGDDVG